MAQKVRPICPKSLYSETQHLACVGHVACNNPELLSVVQVQLPGSKSMGSQKRSVGPRNPLAAMLTLPHGYTRTISNRNRLRR